MRVLKITKGLVDKWAIWVNWFQRDHIFDFTEVVIRKASDKDVERFVMRVSNQADKKARELHKKVSCKIAKTGDLSENSYRLLQSRFGVVSQYA